MQSKLKHFIVPFLLLLSLNGFGKDDYDDYLKAKNIQDSIDHVKALSVKPGMVSNPYEVERFRFQMDQNKKVYAWQNLSSIIIFFVVILIVLVGLYLSYRQFILGEKMLLAKQEIKTIETGPSTVEVMNASLEFGKEGVKINTAVIGLVILIISLSFLFLYLKYVYPISVVKA